MDHKVALTTAITLAYRESVSEDPNGVSTDIIYELLPLIKVSEANLGQMSNSSPISNVKSTLSDMCKQAESSTYDSADLLTRLKINTQEDEKWYQAIEKSINSKLDHLGISRSIVTLRAKLRAMINQEKVAKLLREKSSEWSFRYDGIADPGKYLQEFSSELESIITHSSIRDNAINDSLDFSDLESVKNIAKKVEAIESGTVIWKTGWQDLNDMLQEGFREGECWALGALPHMDKTGTSLTIFKQLALYNKPRHRKPGKKPTLLRVTLEDPLTNNLNYLYKNIMFNETGEEIDTKGVPYDVIAKTVHDKLHSTGFSVKLYDVDPSDWSYRNLINLILKLDSEGSDIQVLMVDYLSMIPTTGCRQGPHGTDLQDLFRRVRNFCRSRGILFITPHQLSTEAMNLTRGVVTDETLLPHITLKGFWQDAKGLAREFDGAFYIHLIKKEDGTYKHFVRDKHRWPGILPEHKKSFFHKYPGNMPVPDDIGKERIGMKRIGRAISNVSEDMFNFG